MRKQILVLHGGNAFDTYEEYILDLQSKEISIERLAAKDWKSNLSSDLGDEYDVILPRMPNSNNARYLEWKIWFEKIVALLDETVVFIGHSLGGIFLVKYLSENNSPKKIKGLFLVAAPYNTPKDHPLVDFTITNSLDRVEGQSEKIFLYHSKDDVVVPFDNAESYQTELRGATLRVFEDRGHFNSENFPEIVQDIKLL
jgi:uncharacterized protein